ncbi:hypothetical protein PNEG_01809 [Pneumocystis murina B123]|uniref:Uncharacterized protein n=1 Tax=Pneumocystis murina (strain B123) TaxID=1069680 RepID=M7NSF8_PNEMU|nr:hypothetical protein PNEG_01809 [Pneumocystis murina B123]EMR10056.1 hypothetical protein PNEG_01809 [Pneumocystis murina B123]
MSDNNELPSYQASVSAKNKKELFDLLNLNESQIGAFSGTKCYKLFFWGILFPFPILLIGAYIGLIHYGFFKKNHFKDEQQQMYFEYVKEEEIKWGKRCFYLFGLISFVIASILLAGFKSNWTLSDYLN